LNKKQILSILTSLQVESIEKCAASVNLEEKVNETIPSEEWAIEWMDLADEEEAISTHLLLSN